MIAKMKVQAECNFYKLNTNAFSSDVWNSKLGRQLKKN